MGFYFMTRKMATLGAGQPDALRRRLPDHDYARVWAAIQADVFVPHPGICGGLRRT